MRAEANGKSKVKAILWLKLAVVPSEASRFL